MMIFEILAVLMLIYVTISIAKALGESDTVFKKVVSEDLSFRLRFVKVPTVIIWGEKDDYTPLTDANFIHEKITNSKLIVLPNIKHSIQIEAPEILAQKIIENITGDLLSLKNII